MSMLDNTRLSSAARAVGVARACLEHSVKYANEREQFGQPIASFQMIQEQVAEMYVEEEAARLLVRRAAWNRDQGARNTIEVSCAKFYAAEVAVRAANTAVKIFGSYGFSTEYPVERYYRDAKSYQIVEGTSNIQKMIIADSIRIKIARLQRRGGKLYGNTCNMQWWEDCFVSSESGDKVKKMTKLD
jgi:glutaryl-CoA dehydrogenase (non-decarboxylating)